MGEDFYKKLEKIKEGQIDFNEKEKSITSEHVINRWAKASFIFGWLSVFVVVGIIYTNSCPECSAPFMFGAGGLLMVLALLFGIIGLMKRESKFYSLFWIIIDILIFIYFVSVPY